MAEKTYEVIYGLSSQTITFDPPEWPAGIPSSLSFSLWEGQDSLDDDAEWSATPTVDGVSTTVDAASGISQSNPHILYLTSTSSISTGVPYLAENEDHMRELVIADGINDGDSLILRHALVHDYSASNSCTLKGIRISIAIDNTWATTESNLSSPGEPAYKGILTYTVNSVVRKQYLYLKLVRQQWQHGVKVTDVEPYWADIRQELAKHERGTEAIQRLIDVSADEVRADILAVPNYEPHLIRDGEIVRLLVIFKFLMNFCIDRGKGPGKWDPAEYLPLATKRYETLFQKHVSGSSSIKVDIGTEGNAEAKRLTSMWLDY